MRGEKKQRGTFCFSQAHDNLKTKRFCWMGYLIEPQDFFFSWEEVKRRKWFSNVIPKGEKTPTEVEKHT